MSRRIDDYSADDVERMEAALIDEYEESIYSASYRYPSSMERFLLRKLAGLMVVVDGMAQQRSGAEGGE